MLVNDRGEEYIILGGGPTSWDLAWQAISLFGICGFPGASGGGAAGGAAGGQNVQVPYPALPGYSQEVGGINGGSGVLSGGWGWAGWQTLPLPIAQSRAVAAAAATIHGWARPHLMTGRGGEPEGPGAYSRVLEDMHLLPKEFADKFSKAGLNVEDYVIKLERGRHRLKAYNGVHTNVGGNWNRVWREFFKENPNRTKQEILDKLAQMLKDFGLE